MSKRNAHLFKAFIFLLIIVLHITPCSYASDVGKDDTLLNLLPEDCMFCIRVSNFNESLGKLDTYLAGASPVPMSLAMVVNMQLGAIIGDPTLSGLSLGGDFALFAVLPQTDQDELSLGILVPVENYANFVKANPNCKSIENGLTLLSPPPSPVSPTPSIGNFILAPAGDTYALVVNEAEKTSISTLQKALKADSKISKRLSPAQTKSAITAPVWGYVNFAGLYDKFNQNAMTMFEMAQKGMKEAGGPAEMMKFYFKMLPELFKEFAGDMDSATFAMTPEPTILTLDIGLRAKDGSELAKMLVADKNTESYQLTAYLDDTNAINALMKMNRPLMQTFYDKIFDIMAATAEDAETKEQTEKMKALTQQMLKAMGDEVSFSYSYAGSMPPFRLQEVIEIKDSAAMKAMMTESMDYANSLYKTMGIPAELKYEPGVSTYKGATIDSISISIPVSDDPNMVIMQKEIQKLYGDGIKYYMAQTADKFYVAIGPDTEQMLKDLIDQSASAATLSGDIKVAMDALQNTPYNDFVCSINVIKLMKGMSEMMQSMGAQEGMHPAAMMFSGLKDVQTKSCLVTGGKIADGRAVMRLAIPKQHLIEIIGIAMQIQQQAMAMQTQVQGSSDGITPQTESVNEVSPDTLQSWVGKPAPELKMVDLDGKTHHISKLKGKKVILDFWATWCPPCKKSIPDLIKMADSGNSDLTILGLSNEPTDKLAPFVKEAKMNYPVITYNDKEVPAPYNQVTAIPTLLLIDSKGVIQDVLVGYHELEILQTKLKQLD